GGVENELPDSRTTPVRLTGRRQHTPLIQLSADVPQRQVAVDVGIEDELYDPDLGWIARNQPRGWLETTDGLGRVHALMDYASLPSHPDAPIPIRWSAQDDPAALAQHLLELRNDTARDRQRLSSRLVLPNQSQDQADEVVPLLRPLSDADELHARLAKRI